MNDILSNLLNGQKEDPQTVLGSNLTLEDVGEILLGDGTLHQRDEATRRLICILNTSNEPFQQVKALAYLSSTKEPLRDALAKQVHTFMADAKNGEVVAMVKRTVKPATHRQHA